jgi:hypothetical protein
MSTKFKTLLKNSNEVWYCDNKDLFAAVENADMECLASLLNQDNVNARIIFTNGQAYSLLFFAVKQKLIQAVNLLLAQKSVDAELGYFRIIENNSFFSGMVFGICADLFRKQASSKELLEYLADVEAREGKEIFFETNLHQAAAIGFADAIVPLATAHGVNVNCLSRISIVEEETALHAAANANSSACITELLKLQNVDANAKSSYGETALYYAAEQHEEAFSALLSSNKVSVNSVSSADDFTVLQKLNQAWKRKQEAIYVNMTKQLLARKDLQVNSNNELLQHIEASGLSDEVALKAVEEECVA